ncbi:lectin-like domain-containing protein [Pediococcus argentinicus]
MTSQGTKVSTSKDLDTSMSTTVSNNATATNESKAVAPTSKDSNLGSNQGEVSNKAVMLSKSVSATPNAEDLNNVNKNNLTDYFNVNGNATYDKSTGIVTLTKDSNNQSGNITLKDKINMDESFTLQGQINLGNKPQHAGADGMSFGFHDGDSNEVGRKGGSMGLGGLSSAFGWKADTYWNQLGTSEDTGYFEADPDQFKGNSGKPGYRYDGEGVPFGGFVYTQTNNGIDEALNYVGDDAPAMVINNPANNAFEPIEFKYDGQTKMMTVNFEGNTWSKSVATWIHSGALAFFITASTGGSTNLQQFQMDSFVYVSAASVDVKYIDQNGNKLAEGVASYPNGAYNGNSYTTEQKVIDNYQFIKMGDDSLPANGTLTRNGNNGTVVYVYAPAYSASVKTINQTIDYVDQAGHEVSTSHNSEPVSFVTVTNPVDKTTTVYYSTGKQDVPSIGNDGVPSGSNWIKGTSISFESVTNPEVAGYQVIKNNAPGIDLKAVASQSVAEDGADQHFTVTYAPSEPGTLGKPSEPGTPGKPSEPGTPGKPSEPGTPGKPSEPGTPGKPSEPGTPGKPSEPGTPGKPSEPGIPGKPSEPGIPGKPSEPGISRVPKKTNLINSNRGLSYESEFPQTNDDDLNSSLLSLIGLFVLGLFGIGGYKRRH